MRELLLKLLRENKELKERIEKLEGKANKDSSNSNKPPSSDSPYDRASRNKKKKKKKSGSKAGGKRGHKGYRQRLLKLTDEKNVLPEQIKPFYTHQEIELPEIEMEVVHFIMHEGKCTQCGKTVKGRIPEEHRSRIWCSFECTDRRHGWD